MSPPKIAQPVLSVVTGMVVVGPVSVAVMPASPTRPLLPVLPVEGVVPLTTTDPPTGGVTMLCRTTGGRLPMFDQLTDDEVAISSAVVPVWPATQVAPPVPVM